MRGLLQNKHTALHNEPQKMGAAAAAPISMYPAYPSLRRKFRIVIDTDPSAFVTN